MAGPRWPRWRAAQRLTELLGEPVIPLEDEISKAAGRHFPRLQYRFGPLAEKLRSLHLPGVEAVRGLSEELAELLLSDASDAPQRLGGEESPLYDGLRWAGAVDTALRNRLEETVRDLQWHRGEIEALPAAGLAVALQDDLQEDLALAAQRLSQSTFHQHAADLNSLRTAIKARVRSTALLMAEGQRQTLAEAAHELQRLPEWSELTQEEQSQTLARLDDLVIETTPDLHGVKRLLNQEYVIQATASDLKRSIERHGRDRRVTIAEPGLSAKRTITLPARLTSVAQLEALLRSLEALRIHLDEAAVIEFTIESSSDY